MPSHALARRAGRGKLPLETELRDEPVLALRTSNGELRIVPEPAGTRRGYDDLRRAATREHIPSLGQYWADSGNQTGAISQNAPLSWTTTIWCQNWSVIPEGATCGGSF